MQTREEYVKHLKSQLDVLNAQADDWEVQAKKIRDTQLAAYRNRRDETLYQLRLVEGASSAAWEDIATGADAALASMKDAFTHASVHFARQKGGTSKA